MAAPFILALKLKRESEHILYKNELPTGTRACAGRDGPKAATAQREPREQPCAEARTFAMPVGQTSIPARSTHAPTSGKAAAYEAEHVHEVYDKIAEHFSATRHTPWPRVEAFLRNLPEQALVFDIGCGNGKYLAAVNNLPIYAIGSDRCLPLVRLAACAAPAADVVTADVLGLPFRDAFFDAALCIAVIHHMSTGERRVRALAEVVRILRPRGRALIYVWALERPVSKMKSNTAMEQTSDKRDKPNMLNRRFEAQDMLVPWHMRSRKEGADSDRILGDWHDVHHRFYHVYREGELETELAMVERCRVVESYYDHQNWCAVVEKV